MNPCLPLRLVACTATAMLGLALGACAPVNGSIAQPQAAAFSLAVIGDTPYGNAPDDTAQLRTNPQLVAAINADPEVTLVLHTGDIHSGKQYCTREYNAALLEQWRAFTMPLVYTPGDNEWLDCHKAKQGGGKFNKSTGAIDYVMDANGQPASFAKGDPLANLALVRATFFARPGQTLGAAMRVHTQATEFDLAHPADQAFVENVWWEQSGVLFVAVNIPGGSNNGTDPWYGAPTLSTAQQQEVAVRRGATLRWLQAAFARATAGDYRAMVLLTQADLWDVNSAEGGAAHLSNLRPYVDALAAGTRAFAKPVLALMGDSHVYRSDNPLVQGAPCVIEPAPGAPAVACADGRAQAALAKAANPSDPYLAQPHGYTVPNFHRIVVHGENAPREWLKLRVDPADNAPAGDGAFGPFRWERVRPPL